MSVGAIILLVAVCGVFLFEVFSLIATIIKKRKAKVKPCAEDNNEKEVDV